MNVNVCVCVCFVPIGVDLVFQCCTAISSWSWEGGRNRERERERGKRERERKKKEREISILHTILAGICTYLGEEIHEEVTKSTERSKHSVHLGLRQTPFPTEKRKHHNLQFQTNCDFRAEKQLLHKHTSELHAGHIVHLWCTCSGYS